MSKYVGFIIGAIEVGVGIFLETVPGMQAFGTALIVSGAGMIVTQAVVDLTAPKQPGRNASEMAIALGEQPRVMLVGETFTPGSLVDGFDWGGKYGTDWEGLIIRLADHKCHSLTGFFVNDDYNLYTADGIVPRYDDQLQIFFRADTSTDPLPTIVTTNGPGWTSDDIGQSGCDVIVAYKADKADDKHPGWPGGRPRFGFVVKGKKCYDPRLDSTVTGGSGSHRWDDPDTWEWSENAVVCWYNYERGVFSDDDTSDPTKLLVGRGLSAEESPPEYIFAAANLCDEKLGTIYPSLWVPTSVAFDPTSLSPDGTTLYTISSSVLGAVNLATRSQILNVTLPTGSLGGPAIAATNNGAYFVDSTYGLFFCSRSGTVVEVLDQPGTGMFSGGVGYAGGDIWLYPQSFSPNVIGKLDLATSGYSLTTVGYNATQVFTSVGGTAIAVGTTTGHVLAIGPAGSTGTLIDTTAYGTTGDVCGFDAGTHFIAQQGDHLFIINNTGTPAIVSAVSVGTLLRVYEGFAATRPGAGSFWIDGVEFDSSDLSTIRTPILTPFPPTSGGTGGGGLLYDPINHALIVVTSGAFGMGFYLLDRDGSYRVAGPIYSTQPFIDVEQMFASATAGAIVTRDGAVELEPGVAKSVVETFSDADLVVGSKVSWNQGFLSESSDDWVNTVVTQYIEPAQNWNSHASPALRSEADIIADGKPREQQITLRLVRYLAQALRIAEIGRRLGRLWGRATVTLGPRFCEIEDNDWVSWQSDRYFGGGTKTFRVDAYSIDEKWQNTLNLREINGAAFAADGVYPIDYSRSMSTPPPPDTGSPDSGNWTLSPVELTSTGATIPALEITGSSADDVYVEAIVFEYWLDDGSADPTTEAVDWITYGRLGADTTKVDITSVTGGASYYAAVTYVVGGVLGDRLVLGPVNLADFTTGTGGGGGGGTGGPFATTGQLGMPGAFSGGDYFSGANTLSLQQIPNRMDAACTFSTYEMEFGTTTAAGAKFKPVLYSDNGSNLPGALIATGSEITLSGSEASTNQTYSFGSTQTLAANTEYWFGFITDTDFRPKNGASAPSTNGYPGAQKISNTYASGAPSSPTGFSDTGGVICILLNVTLARGAVGYWDSYNQIGSDWITGAGEADVLKITTPAGGTCSADKLAVRLSWSVTNGSKFKGVIYADSGGSPGALIATGSEITVATGDANGVLESTFSGVTLSASTTYWIGIWNDDANRLMCGYSVSGFSQSKSGGTYASGPFASMSGSSEAGKEIGFYLLFS